MFGEVWIDNEVPDSFRKLIPVYFDGGIRSGEIAGIGFYDDFYSEPVIVGVVLFRIRNTWLEIVWTEESDAFKGGSTTADMLNSCVRKMTNDEKFTGVFTEFPESDTALSDAFMEAGFTVDRTRGGVYEFNMSMVDKVKLTGTAKYRPFCCNLGNADKLIKTELEASLRHDSRDLPVVLPINYNEYDPDLSFIFRKGTSFGLLLSKKDKGYVTIEVVISQNPAAFLTMISSFVDTFDKICEKDCTIFIPVITQEADKLLKKIVPDARENEVFQAYLYLK